MFLLIEKSVSSFCNQLYRHPLFLIKKGILEQCDFKGVLIYQISLILSYYISILSRLNDITHSLKSMSKYVSSLH